MTRTTVIVRPFPQRGLLTCAEEHEKAVAAWHEENELACVPRVIATGAPAFGRRSSEANARTRIARECARLGFVVWLPLVRPAAGRGRWPVAALVGWLSP